MERAKAGERYLENDRVPTTCVLTHSCGPRKRRGFDDRVDEGVQVLAERAVSFDLFRGVIDTFGSRRRLRGRRLREGPPREGQPRERRRRGVLHGKVHTSASAGA